MKSCLSKNPAVLLLVMVPSLLKAQDDGMDIEYESSNVKGNIYLLTDPEVFAADNVVVSAGSDGLLMIDSAYLETLNTVRPLVNDLGGSVKVLVNTHFHHAGANAAFGPNATIIAHSNVRKRMQQKSQMYGQFPIGPWPKAALPDIIFDSTLTLHFNGEKIKIIHFPNAHTDGDAVVLFTETNVVVTGDIFVSGLGACDHQNGGKWSAYLDSIDRLLQIVPKDAKIIPGHGPVSTYEDLQQAKKLLDEMTELIQQKIDEDKELETILSEGMPDRWESLGGLPAKFFLTNVYQGLKAE